MGDNQKAKRSVITSFFDDAEARVAFLDELADTGHEPEAMTLCLVYIDRFAQSLCWPSASTGRNFVDALIQFGGEPLMALAHPLQAARAFGAMKTPWKALAERIAGAFPGPSHEVVPIPTFEQALAEHVTTAELAQLKPELWRATIANVAYQHFGTRRFMASALVEESFSRRRHGMVSPYQSWGLPYLGTVPEAS